MSRVRHQTENGIRHQNEAEEQEEELDAVSKDLSILLREQESFRRLRKYVQLQQSDTQTFVLLTSYPEEV